MLVRVSSTCAPVLKQLATSGAQAAVSSTGQIQSLLSFNSTPLFHCIGDHKGYSYEMQILWTLLSKILIQQTRLQHFCKLLRCV